MVIFSVQLFNFSGRELWRPSQQRVKLHGGGVLPHNKTRRRACFLYTTAAAGVVKTEAKGSICHCGLRPSLTLPLRSVLASRKLRAPPAGRTPPRSNAVALDASKRGLKTAMVEADDFGAG